jgi:hypothetical protein
MYKNIVLLFLFFLISCECPPQIDTSKEIIPNEYSYCIFFNINSDYKVFSVNSNKIEIVNSVNFANTSNENYYKFPDNYANLLLFNNNTPIFNTLIYTQKFHYYTFFFYKFERHYSYLFVEDAFPDSSQNSYIRFLNFNSNQSVNFEITSSLPQPIDVFVNMNDYTKLIPMLEGNIDVSIINPESQNLIAKYDNINLKQNSITNIVYMGDSTNYNVYIFKSNK